MSNFLFDIRLNASFRLDAASEAEARAMLTEALDCAFCNAGHYPDGSPVLFEASIDGDDCENDGIELVEVDGEAPPDDGPRIPVPAWATPVAPVDLAHGSAAVFRTIRAAEAQNAAVRAVLEASEVEFPGPTIRDALIYGMGGAYVEVDRGRCEAVTIREFSITMPDLLRDPKDKTDV